MHITEIFFINRPCSLIACGNAFWIFDVSLKGIFDLACHVCPDELTSTITSWKHQINVLTDEEALIEIKQKKRFPHRIFEYCLKNTYFRWKKNCRQKAFRSSVIANLYIRRRSSKQGPYEGNSVEKISRLMIWTTTT